MMKTLLLIALMLFVVPALGQEADPTAATRGLMPFVLAAMIAYVTRRNAIGGWLFYFYLGLFMSTVIVAFMAISTLPNLDPEGWDIFYWWMAVLDYIPWLLATIATFVFGVRLLFKSQRNDKNFIMMRYSMLTVLIFSLASLFISYRYFPEEEGGNILGVFSAISSSIWCLYWFVSKRVKYVMTRGDLEWDYEEFKRQ